MKVSQNCVTKLLGHTQRGFRTFFSKIPLFTLFFIFFLDFSLLFLLFILAKKFWKLLWFFFVCIKDLSKWFWKILKFFFLIIFFKKQPYYVGCGASNRRNKVHTSPRQFLDLNRHGDDFYYVGCLTDVIFNVSWVNVRSGSDDKGLSESMINAIFLLV